MTGTIRLKSLLIVLVGFIGLDVLAFMVGWHDSAVFTRHIHGDLTAAWTILAAMGWDATGRTT